MPPAIKGMEQAHGLLFVPGRTALHDGADQHLNQPAAQGIYDHRGKKPGVCVRQQLRQHSQPQQPGSRKDMGDHDGGPVSDPVDESG